MDPNVLVILTSNNSVFIISVFSISRLVNDPPNKMIPKEDSIIRESRDQMGL